MDTTLPAGADPVHQGVRARHQEHEAFERWLEKEQLLTATWCEERNCYAEFPAHLAFKAWCAAKPQRAAVGAIYNVAAALAQRKPLRALDKLTEATRIGPRQMANAYEQADEETRLLAVKLSDALRAL